MNERVSLPDCFSKQPKRPTFLWLYQPFHCSTNTSTALPTFPLLYQHFYGSTNLPMVLPTFLPTFLWVYQPFYGSTNLIDSASSRKGMTWRPCNTVSYVARALLHFYGSTNLPMALPTFLPTFLLLYQPF